MRIFGYKIFKEKALDSCFFNRDKLFELLLKDIKQPVIFDVGANIGQSIELFKKGAKEAIIHSFEPNIECEAQLRKIAAKYSDVYINMCGIGAGGGGSCCIDTASTPSTALLKSVRIPTP